MQDKKSQHKYNKAFERVEEFKYLGMIFTNQNSIHEEITSREKKMLATIQCRIFCLPVCYPKI